MPAQAAFDHAVLSLAFDGIKEADQELRSDVSVGEGAGLRSLYEGVRYDATVRGLNAYC